MAPYGGIADILSLHNVQKKHKVTYDISQGKVMWFTK